MTGISWGGYLTCIVAGIDDRVKVAVPVYGCGFLDEDSFWVEPRFQKMGPEKTKRWVELFDPSRYLPGVTCPILFVNGTNDFAYPLGSYQKSYRLVTKAPVDLCVTVNMPHGHEPGWAPREIGLFVDSVLKGGTPLPRLSMPTIAGGRIEARVAAPGPVRRGEGPLHDRRRTLAEARVDDEGRHARRRSDLGRAPRGAADRGVLHGRGRARGRGELAASGEGLMTVRLPVTPSS